MKRRYHFTLLFVIYIALTLFVALAAMNSGHNLLYWVFGILTAALLISGVYSGAMMMRLSIRRIIPAHATAGEPIVIRYSVRNRSRFYPAFSLHFEEVAAAARGPRRAKPSAVSAWVMHLGPRETVHGESAVTPSERGEIRFGELSVWSSFPFGFLRKSITTDQPQRLLVYPKMYPLRRRILESITPQAAIGMNVTQHAGAGDDYYGLREYRPGESMRRIAWKRTAGREELVCIEHTRPNPPRLRVLLNLTASKMSPATERSPEAQRSLEEDAISLAASIIHEADQTGYEIGLVILGIDHEPIPIRRAYWHRHRLLAALAEIDLEAPRTVASQRESADARHAGLVVIHPGRVDPAVVRAEAWHLSAQQMSHLVDRDGRRIDVAGRLSEAAA